MIKATSGLPITFKVDQALGSSFQQFVADVFGITSLQGEVNVIKGGLRVFLF